MAGIVRMMLMPEELQDVQKSLHLTRPAPVRQDALFHGQGRSERRGTYQASLEPLASISCERIGSLPSPSPR